jgi:hypothetical protein
VKEKKHIYKCFFTTYLLIAPFVEWIVNLREIKLKKTFLLCSLLCNTLVDKCKLKTSTEKYTLKKATQSCKANKIQQIINNTIEVYLHKR